MVNGIGFGSRTLDATDIVELWCENNGMASGAFSGLTDSSGSVHQVAVSKNLVIDLITVNTAGASSANKCEFGYADDAAGTNYVKLIPNDIMSESTSGRYSTECLMRIPSSKYPVVKSTATNLNINGIFRGVEA